MTLASNALTTASAVTGWGSVAGASSAQIERAINAASDVIARYCGREFYYAERTEYYDPPSGDRIYLRVAPVLSITSIKWDTSTYSASYYTIEDAALGIVKATPLSSVDLGDPWDPQFKSDENSPNGEPILGTSPTLLTIKYKSGYVCPNQVTGELARTLPYDLEQAAIDTVISMLRRRGADLKGNAYDSENTAIGRGVYGYIPGSAIAVLKTYQRILT